MGVILRLSSDPVFTKLCKRVKGATPGDAAFNQVAGDATNDDEGEESGREWKAQCEPGAEAMETGAICGDQADGKNDQRVEQQSDSRGEKKSEEGPENGDHVEDNPGDGEPEAVVSAGEDIFFKTQNQFANAGIPFDGDQTSTVDQLLVTTVLLENLT